MDQKPPSLIHCRSVGLIPGLAGRLMVIICDWRGLSWFANISKGFGSLLRPGSSFNCPGLPKLPAFQSFCNATTTEPLLAADSIGVSSEEVVFQGRPCLHCCGPFGWQFLFIATHQVLWLHIAPASAPALAPPSPRS